VAHLVCQGMGTACTRAGERLAAALGLSGAAARFERCRDVAMGGLLAGLPALCGNGLLSGIGKHLSLADGYYSVLHILTLMGFMALPLFFRFPSDSDIQPESDLLNNIG